MNGQKRAAQMADRAQTRFSRRSFLKGLGALALGALPACRRAQEFAVQPDEAPEWALPGECTCYATSMPWAAGAYPLLAVCYDGVPVALQAHPRYTARAGLPAHVQASLLDLYSPERPAAPTLGGREVPWSGVRHSLRAWARALRQGRRTAFLFPAGYSAVRDAQIRELAALPAVACYTYDPLTQSRYPLFEPLASMQREALGDAVAYSSPCGTLAELAAQLPEVELLFIFTPADPAALDAGFAAALAGCTAESVRFSPRPADATGKLCLYTVPQTHYLEEWGAEADAFGHLCLRQPITQPLVPALAEADVLHALLHDGELPPGGVSAHAGVPSWLEQVCPEVREQLKLGFIPQAAPLPRALPPADAPTPYLHPLFADGRFLHNAWLREAYDPLCGAAGAPAVYLPPPVAGDAPAAVRLGPHTLPAGCVAGLSAPCLPMLPGVAAGDTPSPLADSPFPTRQARPLPAASAPPELRTSNAEAQWGLVIDYTLCIGCNACTIACRAENNIPIVGAEEQRKGRDLQWLRIDRYTAGSRLYFVPSACRQCGNAPCEAVCPVNATVHTSDGLNAMVYPRCWGTRYCAAACPYHARTFNYYDYARTAHSATALPPNPQVTVRSRGIMEKCTCCTQRIRAAKLAGSATPPQTACQQACPRGAIRLINRAVTPLPPHLTARFDTPGTYPATLYTETTPP